MWGVPRDKPSLAVLTTFYGKPATVGNGTMVSLVVTATDKVDRVYAKALALGGKDEGPAGPRGDSSMAAHRPPGRNKPCSSPSRRRRSDR